MALDALACRDSDGRHTHPNLDLSLQPTGLRRQRALDGTVVLIDVTATLPCGCRVDEVTPGADLGD